MIALWILLGVIVVVIWSWLINYGIKYCFKNNAIGIIILFITLNILGLVIGWAILWNIKIMLEGNFLENSEKLSKIRNEIKQSKKIMKEEKNKLTAKEYREWRDKKIKEKEKNNN
ncbi:hypothetical protein [Spiroplasma endosymbiont of Villa modesta]|uniref:hypothetical protein n=1 Tax=Spiroplasma endosymbiont of Villa modesta TaxID=3066293 RepID=UPI00313D9D90